jgi:hypothetical protein
MSISLYPGDSWAEYFLLGHATKEEFENMFGKEYSDRIKYQQGTFPATRLNGLDGAPLSLEAWNGFPDNNPNTGVNNTVGYWDAGVHYTTPAIELPDIIGMDVEDAKRAMISCGVDPKILVPIEFDAPEEYRYSGYNPSEGHYYSPLNAPGSDWSGVIMYRYMDPNHVVGQHWDGSPAYAHEFNNKVQYMSYSPANFVPTEPTTGWYFNNYQYTFAFLVIQTENPRYNSYQWWD